MGASSAPSLAGVLFCGGRGAPGRGDVTAPSGERTARTACGRTLPAVVERRSQRRRGDHPIRPQQPRRVGQSAAVDPSGAGRTGRASDPCGFPCARGIDSCRGAVCDGGRVGGGHGGDHDGRLCQASRRASAARHGGRASRGAGGPWQRRWWSSRSRGATSDAREMDRRHGRINAETYANEARCDDGRRHWLSGGLRSAPRGDCRGGRRIDHSRRACRSRQWCVRGRGASHTAPARGRAAGHNHHRRRRELQGRV